jgi:putative tributyrin esterase
MSYWFNVNLFITFIFSLNVILLTAQDQLILKSDLIPGDDTIWIFKPIAYNSADYYPAIYMLHGLNGNYSSWNELVRMQEYSDKYQFIIICPDGFSDSYYLNSPVDSNSQFESFFADVLYPKMIEFYSIDKSKIFITGLSMGGSGAMSIFLRHPELFLSAGSTSGVMDLNFSQNKFKSLSCLLGDYHSNRKVFDSFSPVNLLYHIQGSDKSIIFDCGSEDYLYECNNSFRKKCDELKINATYIVQPGKHERSYWQKSIHYHFEFFNSLLEK